MIVATPVSDGKLSMHFGHCEFFEIFEVNLVDKVIKNHIISQSPVHQPGLLPGWLAKKKVNLVISSGMGIKAQNLLKQFGIEVITGAPSEVAESIIKKFLNSDLSINENQCLH